MLQTMDLLIGEDSSTIRPLRQLSKVSGSAKTSNFKYLLFLTGN